jgi:hypothetical protein
MIRPRGPDFLCENRTHFDFTVLVYPCTALLFFIRTIHSTFSKQEQGVSGGLFEGTKYLDLGARGDCRYFDRIISERSYRAYPQPEQRRKNVFHL